MILYWTSQQSTAVCISSEMEGLSTTSCIYQGVTKRCRLSWLTNSAIVYEPKCGGRGLRGLSQRVQLCSQSPNKFCFYKDETTYKLISQKKIKKYGRSKGSSSWNCERKSKSWIRTILQERRKLWGKEIKETKLHLPNWSQNNSSAHSIYSTWCIRGVRDHR